MAIYRARPVEVEAFQITHVSHHLLGKHTITLDNGESVTLEPGQVSRMTPAIGDYLVKTYTPDIYVYLNPKFVFEAKYDLVGGATTPVAQLGLISAAKAKIEAGEVAPDNGVNVIIPDEQPDATSGEEAPLTGEAPDSDVLPSAGVVVPEQPSVDSGHVEGAEIAANAGVAPNDNSGSPAESNTDAEAATDAPAVDAPAVDAPVSSGSDDETAGVHVPTPELEENPIT